MCSNHPNRQTIAKCSNCGNDVCAECLVELASGNIACKTCIDRSFMHRTSTITSVEPKKFNALLLLFFSALPGAGHMYLGLMKKGLLIMSSFFITIYFLVILSYNSRILFAFAIPVIWFASFFDGFNIRRKLNKGMLIEDNCNSIINIVSSNKYIILIVAATLIVMEFISKARNTLEIYPLPSIIIIAIGFFMIIKSKKK